MVAEKKIIVVFGGTGGQGGSVVKTLLKDEKMMQEWKIRAVTRDITKPAAKALTEKGVEMVSANLDDPATIKTALHGAYAVYLVTNYWESMSGDIEKKQGMNVADAAKEEGISHLIFSSLLNITELSGGVYKKVCHFDSKADIEAYIRKIGVPATFFLPAVYMSNYKPKGQLQQSPDPPHAWTIAMPTPPKEKVVPLIWAEEDTGKFVKGILKHREQVLGKRVLGAEAYYSMEEMIKIFAEVKSEDGKGAQAVELPPAAFRGILEKSGMPAMAAEELSENFEMLGQCGYYGKATFEESHALLDEPLNTWRDYVSKAKEFANLK